jgi:hypothetical protein
MAPFGRETADVLDLAGPDSHPTSGNFAFSIDAPSLRQVEVAIRSEPQLTS